MFVIVITNKNSGIKTMLMHGGATRVFDSRHDAQYVIDLTFGKDNPEVSCEVKLLFCETV